MGSQFAHCYTLDSCRYEHACEQFDFAGANSLLATGARWIEDSYPEPARFDGTGWSKRWEDYKTTKMEMHQKLRDLVTHRQGEVAWVTVAIDSTWTANTDAATALNGNQHVWQGTFVESIVLVKEHGTWKIALGHTSLLPKDSH
jgi:hypothetical protein